MAVLEERIAALEGGRAAVAASSGHAAQFLTFFTLMEPGDEFVASRNLYGGSLTQFGLSFKKLGWTCHFVDPTEPENFREALTPKCKAIFIENLANPGGIVVDIERVAGIAHEAGLPLIVDNTLATPYLCRPIEHGADIVVHSTTKFLSGHGNALGGVVVESGKFDWSQGNRFPVADRSGAGLSRAQVLREFRRLRLHHEGAGGRLARFRPRARANERVPHHHRGRDPACADGAPRRECAEGRGISRQHPKVAWVSYASLKDSAYFKLAQKYLPKGAGAVFTFGVKGGYEAGVRLVEGVRLFSHLANIGDTRSLILHPASTTHRQLTDEQRAAAGAGDDVIRLSIGLETADDLIRDLDQALEA